LPRCGHFGHPEAMGLQMPTRRCMRWNAPARAAATVVFPTSVLCP